MNNFEKSLREITAKSGEHWVILDVDRVLFNTTSWFQACIAPNLIISEHNIAKFIEHNNKAYAFPPTLTKEAFREKTLNLLDDRITPGFLDLLKTNSFKSTFKLNANVNQDKLFVAGKYISTKLHIYQEPLKYLSYLSRRYGSSLRVLYLSAGFTPFIRGVIEGIHESQRISDISFQVFGSGISFSNGRGHELFCCQGELKKRVAQKILTNKGSILFACDDDLENESMLALVREHGGKTLKIIHKSGDSVNDSWRKFIKSNLSVRQISMSIELEDPHLSLYKKERIAQDYPHVFSKFKSRINKIGIMSLSEEDYQDALEMLLQRCERQSSKSILRHFFSAVTFRKGSKVFLRGRYYYHWLPEYIFLDSRTNYQKWLTQMKYCMHAFEIIDEENILHLWKRLRANEKLLLLCMVDNFKNAILHAFNTINTTCIENKKYISNELLQYINTVSLLVTDIYYQLVLDEYDKNTFKEFIKKIDINKLSKAMDLYQESQIGMRELDDPRTIILSVLSTLQQIQNKGARYDYIIDFPCGGIELGLAFQSTYKILNKNISCPKLIHCYYSSKKRMRSSASLLKDDEWLSQFIPRNFIPDFRKSCKEGKVLIYDNNAMTFNTLAEVKEYFKTRHGKKIDAVVAAVCYENIAKYLLSYSKVEELHLNWKNTLDYHPVSSYITAFNTWGTSEKSKILESLFMSQQKKMTSRFNKNSVSTYPIYKICRVHNHYDMGLALKNGANMIGIHAVYDNRLQYLKSQKIYKPFKAKELLEEKLPIASYEVEAIRNMQKYMPDSLIQAIIFETKLSSDEIKKTVDIYGVGNKKFFVQLQHRTDKIHIQDIKTHVTQHLIITIGVFQKDFYDYFATLNAMLDEKTDFILIDCSKHQPDFIHSKLSLPFTQQEKLIRLKNLAGFLRKSKIPILLADDVDTEIMSQYLNIIGDCIQGIDMQNNIEVPSYEQRYRLIYGETGIHQIRVRKSSDKLYRWGKFSRSKVFRQLGLSKSIY